MTRVGILAPQYGADAASSIECATAADRLGLDVWLAGQMMPMPASNALTALEPLALMGAIAQATERARLGFMALAAPYLSPLYLAKSLLTLDEISEGRIEAGLGAGWRRSEFEALGVEYRPIDERLAAVSATVDSLEELSGEPVEESQRRWPADARAGTERPRPPVWIAGMGPKVLELAARRADWTNFAKGISAESFAEKAAIVRHSARERARPPRLSLTATFISGESDDLERRLGRRAASRGMSTAEYVKRLREANVFVGNPSEMADQMREFVEIGCDAFAMWPLDGRHRSAVEELGEAAGALADGRAGR